MSRLGIVTYNIAKDWDLPSILSRLERLGYEGVELRTTHKHGVEVDLNADQRKEVRKRFDDSAVELAGLGSAFEFQSPDPAVVQKNIDGTKQYVRPGPRRRRSRREGPPQRTPLGRDAGGPFTAESATLSTKSVRTPPASAFKFVWRSTDPAPRNGRGSPRILDAADHPNVVACWNSNPADVTKAGTIAPNYGLVAGRIGEVHLRDLTDEKYPWRELFRLLATFGFRRLHPRRDPRQHRPRAGLAILPRPVARLSTSA